MRIVSLACIFLFLTGFLLPAQIGTEGAFFGTVTDSSGSAVPGAEVAALHVGTGLLKRATTDADGSFSILSLPIGQYTVTVKAKGFKTWEIAKAELTVGDRNRLSPVLTVGEITESVSVTGNAELLQTEKTSAETVVQMRQIRELPLDTRNPLALVSLVPGMRWASTQSGGERATYVQGQGLRSNKAAFQLDGLVSNAPMDEGGTGMPNVDTVAEFTVETLNFSAENGRDPIQVKVATKSGTNELHGAAWEFLQNDAFNSRNTFATKPPRVRRNQFGAAVGGPVIKNRTFFFGSFEGTVIHNEQIWNTQAVTSAMKTGDFSGLGRTIIDPLTKSPFPNNVIPTNRISNASKYFLPKLLEANSPGGLFKANTGTVNNTWEGTGRVDHQINDAQRIYARYVTIRQPSTQLGYKPSAVTDDTVSQHNIGVNYTWTMSSNTVLTLLGGMLRTRENYTNAELGVNNDALSAGIQGFPTAGREKWIGPPNLNIGGGYQGISYSGWGAPGSLWGSVYNAKADLRHFRGAHTMSAGFEYGDSHTYGDHGSCCVRGTYNFGNLYTNDGFADYLLGLTSSSSRNAPLAEFGTNRAPYAGFYVNDSWRLKQNFTIELGLRYERWFARHNMRQATSTWDPKLQKVVAAVQGDGNINTSAFLNTPNVAAATAGLWTTARQAGYSDNLLEGNGNWAPRIGAVYRPFAQRQIVLRAAYGLFYNSFTGNRSASSAANLPFWGVESLGFGLSQLQPWETVWSSDPNAFGIFGIGEAVDPRLKAARTHEWNMTVQTALPWKSALTLSYVGTKVDREVIFMPYNAPTVGPHTNLQADRPNPLISSVQRMENYGRNWYNALQAKAERRFANGVSFTFSYSFSRSMGEASNGSDEGTSILAFSPAWYNRGRTSFDFRHVEFATLVWELPFGNGRHYLSSVNRLTDAALGGWDFSFTQQGRSGAPFSIGGGYSNLGNGDGSRANLVGDPHISNPTPDRWFNTAAFASPALYTFGSAPLGILEGPGAIQFNTSLSKRFRVAEKKDLQFRWEAFNALNRVNYNTPNTNVASTQLGRITGAGSARYMQLALKFLF
ncbi:TonB-dependent receptor [Paludibaculum fermentans]|uniref:Carboxypeptidase regulatory-like domain-containing protein n=1 Tax=Paludibaculum fermentans TaxID=1473598 RepID=A0A7S7SLP8_PALFE|nr:carboxypeptidase-like regulatory domain-containing protein [Paludibaculum fermentans]QOY89589.1 carboxypeptidase regulatory-like domain-containing protein [Paludibaculum fermentans]